MTINLKETVSNAIAASAAQAAADPTNSVDHADIPKVIATAQQVAAPAVQEAQSRIDYLTNNESLMKSWAAGGAGFSILTGIYGLFKAFSDGWQPVEDETLIIVGVGALMSAAMFIIGRWRGKPIGE